MAQEVSDIAGYLENYTRFTGDKRTLPLGENVAYFIFDMDTKKTVFRKGGYVSVNDPKSENIGFSNYGKTWFAPRALIDVWIHKPIAPSDEDTKVFKRQIKKYLSVADKIEKARAPSKTRPVKPTKKGKK